MGNWWDFLFPCDVKQVEVALEDMGADSKVCKGREAGSPASVVELEIQVPDRAKTRCFRSPLRTREGWEPIYLERVVFLTQEMVRAYVNSYAKHNLFTRTGSSIAYAEGGERDKACTSGIMDPRGVLLGAILLLRMVYPPKWLAEKYAENEICLMASLLMFSFKYETALTSASNRVPATRMGFVLQGLLDELCRKDLGIPKLEDVQLFEAEILAGPVRAHQVLTGNPVQYAHEEVSRLIAENTLKARDEWVVRSMFSFFMLSALLNPRAEVFEVMGTWATAEEIGKGLVHVCVTSLEASRGRHHQYARGPNVRRVALVLQEEATSPHAECLRAGPYTAGTTPRGHCSQVGNGVSRRALRATGRLLSECGV